MGMFLKAGSQFLTAISGLQNEMWLKWIMTGLLLLVLFYTVLGGMVSVVITDLIQFFVLGIGMLIVTGFVVGHVSIDGLAAVVTEHNGYYNPFSSHNPSPIQGGGGGIGPLKLLEQAVVIFTAIMLWPSGVSRTLSVKSSDVAQKLYLYSTVPFLARRALPMLWGIGAFAFFAMSSDLWNQLGEAVEQNGNGFTLSAMPLFLAKIIPSGLLGLVTTVWQPW